MNDDELDRQIRSGLASLLDRARPPAPFPSDVAAGSGPQPHEPDQQGPGTSRARHLSIAAALVLVAVGLGVWVLRDDGSDIDAVDSSPEDPVGFEGWEPGWHTIDPGPVPAMDLVELAWSGERLIVSGLLHPTDEELVPRVYSYDPATRTWTELPTPPREMNRIVAAGETLVVVGFDDEYPGEPVREWATLAPGADEWTSHGEVPVPGHVGAFGVSATNKHLVWTGESVIDTQLGAVLDPVTGDARELSTPTDAAAYPHLATATPVWTGEKVVLSSWSPLPGLAWDAAGADWREVPGPAVDDWPQFSGSPTPATALGSDVVLVTEGIDGLWHSASLDLATSEWTRLANVPGRSNESRPCPSRLATVGDTPIAQPCTTDGTPLHLIDGAWSEIGSPFVDGCCTDTWLGVDEALIVTGVDSLSKPRAPYLEIAVWIPPSDGLPDTIIEPTTTSAVARDPRTGDASLVDPGPLSPRGGHSVVWSGNEVIVWGGWGDENGSVKHADGAAYELSTGQWRRVAAGPLEPRGNHAAAWTGSEMIIVGGDGRTDGAAYDPVADSWRQLPPAPFPMDQYLESEGRVVTDSVLYIWDVAQDQVARYDFDAERWDQSPGPGFHDVTAGALRVVGSDLIALGASSSTRSPLQVAVADSSVGSWERLEGAVDRYGNPFNPRSSVGLDGVLIAWQAGDDDAALALNLDTGQWQSRSQHELPACEGWWAPQEIEDGLLVSSCGVTVRYQVSQDAWRQVDIGELTLDGRDAVWTGSEIVSWGATCCYGTGGSPFQPNVAWSYTPPP